MQKKNYKLDVLLLAHNEEKTIVKEILNIIKILKKIKFRIIVVEDGSKDKTLKKLKSLKKKITLISSKKRLGYTTALLKGVDAANSKFIMHSDTGNKFDYREIINFYNIISKKKFDLIAGNRIKRFDSIFRQILTKGLAFYCNIFFNINYKDYDCGFKMYKTNVLKEILKDGLKSKNLVSSEIFLRFIFRKKKIKQFNDKYYASKNRISRGLPLVKIFKVIFETILNYRKIKKEII